MRQFNKEQQQEICRLYQEEGKTITFLRQMFHCRDEAIKNILTINHIPLKPKGAKINRLLKEDYFSVIDCEEKAYILGLFFADGNVHRDKEGKHSPQISIGLKLSDESLLQQIRTLLGVGGKIRYDKREKKETAILCFRNLKMANDLEKYGIIPKKTYTTKHLPTNIPEQYEKDFLRGLIDGDGSIYQEKKSKHFRIDFCSYHETICRDFIQRICKVCQINNNNRVANYGTAYHVRINTQKDVKQVVSVLYKDSKISIARKYQIAEKIFNEDNNEEDIVYSDH